jgi:hypothetical protein
MSVDLPDPWAGAPDGTLTPFISPEERDRLIVDRTSVRLLDIHDEKTAHGPKCYVEIEIPDGGVRRVCSFDISDPRHPRVKLLRHLGRFMAEHPDVVPLAVLKTAGNGYVLADPNSVD